MNVRTDLAVEDYEKEYRDQIIEYKINDISVQKIVIDSIRSKKFHKKEGAYYTITTDALINIDHDASNSISKAISQILEELYEEFGLTLSSKILVVGLGNECVTPDSLGPKVIKNVFVTNHLYDLNQLSENLGIVSAIAPGVMGQTGLETSDIVKALVSKTKPALVIVVDALASRSLNRVNRTIQITTAGINPGSGVGNKRKEISEQTLHTKVIAIGVPTVVDVSSIFHDVLAYLEKSSDMKIVKDYEYHLVKDVIDDSQRNYMVTPKEIDEMMNMLSDIVSKAINLSIHNVECYD